MCMSKPNIPPPPPPPQEPKQAESMESRRRRRSTAPGGTMLTGPAGISSGALTTGSPTLLGG